MDKKQKKEMLKQQERLLEKKRIKHDRIFGFFAALANLFFAFLSGLIWMQSFPEIFLPDHIASTEAFITVTCFLVTLLGIVGAYESLHLLFQGTRLNKLFPGIWFWEREH